MKYDLIGRGLSFPLKIGSQGRMILTNENNELQQSIMIILMTPLGQRVMRPTFGCRIHELLFAPNNADTISSAQQYVEEALGIVRDHKPEQQRPLPFLHTRRWANVFVNLPLQHHSI